MGALGEIVNLPLDFSPGLPVREKYEVGKMEYEAEYTPTEPQTDPVYILDGRGQMVKVEVPDDASDN